MIRTILVVLLSASTAYAWAPAAQVIPYVNQASINDFNMLEAVALNAAVGTRTLTLPIAPALQRAHDGYTKLVVVIDYTYSAATTVTVTPTCTIDGGSTYASETSTSISTGTGTVSVYTDSYTTGAASAIIRLVYDVAACTDYKLVFGGASAGAGDLVDVQAALVVGG